MKFLYKVKNFAISLFWHTYSGFPKSDQKLIDERYSICTICNMFDHKNGQCLVCGCNINNKRIFLNKLAWKDQSCPERKW